MGKIIYREKNYAIQEVYSSNKKGYILFNTKMPFEKYHSHLNNFASAKYLILLMIQNRLPLDLDNYRLKSLCRVSDDGEYKDKAIELYDKKQKKDTKKYINVKKKNVYC